MIEGVGIKELSIIPGNLGDVYHVYKKTDPDFRDFGEAYFSTVNKDAVKGWKKHFRMTLNVVVPLGEIRFVIFDDRPESPTKGEVQQVDLSPGAYSRLTVPPGVWMAFQGLGDGPNLLLNIADIPHDPGEAEGAALSDPRMPVRDWTR